MTTRAREAFQQVRREEILEAAMAVLADRGMSATMQDFAAAAGVTAGALYRYYPGKDALVDAVLADCAQQGAAMFGEASERAASALEALILVGATAWEQFRGEGAREHAALSLEVALAAYRKQEQAGSRFAAGSRQLIQLATRLVEQAQAQRQIDPQLNARAVGMTLIAVHHGLMGLLVSLDGEVDTDGAFEVLVTMLRRLAPEED